MKKHSQKELVISALLKGKEQRKHYTHQLQDLSNTNVFGTVAVILKDSRFCISIEEIHEPPVKSSALEEYDVEELHHLSTLLEVEDFLKQRLGIALDELGPARGSRRFISE
ncbi:hypothetical protein MUN81_09485 [Hymenobacter sp. 5317J-9]|uniref:hypothetical protein n=1 Tax=Hymenobacter sp. 5317J-9 TaxID=2932250 RepID=UPI001FD71BA3|nr:hypothetical protein [Hymenobacter sp. 5317J-9]UOQ99710.1 hypothetical protein MUN81_09485 [Hymenobacter sp. 5317J-9]